MASSGFAGRVPLVSVLVLFALLALSDTALADSIAFYPGIGSGLVIFNLGVNGLLLLAIYNDYCRRVQRPQQMGVAFFIIYFLLVVGVISLSGGIIDSLAFWVEEPLVFLVALLLIGSIASLMARVFLGMGLGWSAYTGFAFFMVNLIAWIIIVSTVDDPLLLSPVFLIVTAVFLVWLVHVAARIHPSAARGRVMRVALDPRPYPGVVDVTVQPSTDNGLRGRIAALFLMNVLLFSTAFLMTLTAFS